MKLTGQQWFDIEIKKASEGEAATIRLDVIKLFESSSTVKPVRWCPAVFRSVYLYVVI